MQKTLLLSIKPKYVQEIFSGNKKFEFRKKFPQNIGKIIIYSSSPVKEIVGSFSPGEIFIDRPIKLWDTCNSEAGISKNEFFKYFENKESGIAIEIKNLKKKIVKVPPNFRGPQSYQYIEECSKCNESILPFENHLCFNKMELREELSS